MLRLEWDTSNVTYMVFVGVAKGHHMTRRTQEMPVFLHGGDVNVSKTVCADVAVTNIAVDEATAIVANDTVLVSQDNQSVRTH